jgi:hypothetical protein
MENGKTIKKKKTANKKAFKMENSSFIVTWRERMKNKGYVYE